MPFGDLVHDLGTALLVNLKLAALAFPLTLLVAAVIAALRIAGVPVLRQLLTAYVDGVRITPLLLQLFFVFYALPQWGVTMDASTATVLTMGLHFGAYQSEVFRAAYESVPAGPLEAAHVLGMPLGTRLRRVTLPLALRVAIPPTANTLVELFRGTAVVSLVAIQDIVFTGVLVVQRTRGSSTLVFAIIALFFVAICSPATQLIRVLERRLAVT